MKTGSYVSIDLDTKASEKGENKMLTMTEENILEVYREALDHVMVDFSQVAKKRNIELYDGKTDISLFFLSLIETHRNLRFAKSFNEFANWKQEVNRYRAALVKFEVFGHV